MKYRPPESKDLRNAREQFASLLQRSAVESDFQALFSRCPYVLSRALPLRLHPVDFHPLARPGRSDPDFIFYPRSEKPIWSFGVIELKRPDTTLLTIPRKNVALLSRDAATAIAQAQQYCRTLRSDLSQRLTSNLIIGATDYIFVIAGLSDELAKKLTPSMLQETLDGLLPPRCQIIPYDELLRRFESTLPPRVIFCAPIISPNIRGLEDLAVLAESAHGTKRGINDETMAFWTVIEDRWRAGCYIGADGPRVIDRAYWCVNGTDVLATESPAHIDFPRYIDYLVNRIKSSYRLHRLLVQAQSDAHRLDDVKRLLTRDAIRKLTDAIERCRTSKMRVTWMETNDTDVDLLNRLGMVSLYNVDAGEFYYSIDPLILELWH